MGFEVQALYFQAVSRLTERAEERLELPAGATVSDLAQVLTGRYPALTRLAPCLLFAVNQEHAGGDTLLAEGDEIAIMPPFSGG